MRLLSLPANRWTLFRPDLPPMQCPVFLPLAAHNVQFQGSVEASHRTVTQLGAPVIAVVSSASSAAPYRTPPRISHSRNGGFPKHELCTYVSKEAVLVPHGYSALTVVVIPVNHGQYAGHSKQSFNSPIYT